MSSPSKKAALKPGIAMAPTLKSDGTMSPALKSPEISMAPAPALKTPEIATAPMLKSNSAMSLGLKTPENPLTVPALKTDAMISQTATAPALKTPENSMVSAVAKVSACNCSPVHFTR